MICIPDTWHIICSTICDIDIRQFSATSTIQQYRQYTFYSTRSLHVCPSPCMLSINQALILLIFKKYYQYFVNLSFLMLPYPLVNFSIIQLVFIEDLTFLSSDYTLLITFIIHTSEGGGRVNHVCKLEMDPSIYFSHDERIYQISISVDRNHTRLLREKYIAICVISTNVRDSQKLLCTWCWFGRYGKPTREAL